MQRPKRIIIYGVFCLIIGFVSGFKNTMEAGVSMAGPGVLEQGRTMMEQMGQPLSKSQDQDIDVQIKALSKPVFRVGQGVESAISMIMAGVLFIAGVGLLRDRAWSLRLAKWWAFYAIPTAALTVVLTMRYVYPEMPEYSPGGVMLSSAFMLVVLWAFPVLLLRQLPTAQVKAYLAQCDQQRLSAAAMPMNTNPPTAPAPPGPPPSRTQPPQPPSPQAPAPIPPADNTWRDDPWNDPGSR